LSQEGQRLDQQSLRAVLGKSVNWSELMLNASMYGEGKTRGQVAELGIEATINQACATVVVNENKVVRAYVKLALQANYLNMRELAEGGNQPNLNLSKVKAFEIPLPSLADQTEIVRRIEVPCAAASALLARIPSTNTAVTRNNKPKMHVAITENA
jgi:type I restriction enzyme S subunit